MTIIPHNHALNILLYICMIHKLNTHFLRASSQMKTHFSDAVSSTQQNQLYRFHFSQGEGKKCRCMQRKTHEHCARLVTTPIKTLVQNMQRTPVYVPVSQA